MKKAFFAALAVGAIALLAGATTARSAQPSSLQHYMIGFGHTPTAADKALVKSHGGTVRFSFPSIDVLAVDLAPDQVNAVKQSAGVNYVEPDPVRTPQSLSGDLQASELVPSIDNGLYGLVTTHAQQAQDEGYLGTGVKACVADTGLDTHQSDIAPNFVKGYDAFDPSNPTVDVFDLGVETTETHATHVSGIILGAINGSGIHGVAPEARLYEARVLGTQPDGTVSGTTSQVMAGVQWLADQGCKVINMSLGGGDRSESEQRLYNQIRDNGTLIVVASGNDATNHPSFPGRYESVVTVGAVDRNNQLASFSNTGAQLDLVAPGVDNLSSFPHLQGRDAEVTIGGTTYFGNSAEFSSASNGVSGQFVNCGKALAPSDCGTPPAGTWVAVVQRGSVTFATKAHNAAVAGASGVLLYNNTTVPVSPTLGTPDDHGTPWLPTIIVSQAAGQAIVAGLGTTNTGTLYNIAMDWNLDSGTSMATPHVSGVAALIFGKNPSLTPDQVETIMERTTTDLGVPNYDTTFGWGLVNAKAALAATPLGPSAARTPAASQRARASGPFRFRQRHSPTPDWQGSAMGLTSGSGPFGARPAGEFNFIPDPPTGSVLFFEPVPYRLRGFFAGEAVFDTLGAKLLYETGHLPVYYVPEEHLRDNLLEPSEKQTHCPHKGDASYRSLRVGDRVELDAVWAYREPLAAAAFLAGHAAFYWDKLDEWFVEDEQVFGHPRDPYHRIDTYRASRPVRVSVDGETVAESARAIALFESGLPSRFYLPVEDVRTDLLEPSETKTRCAYKGVASYWNVRAGGTLHEDLAWTYEDPDGEGLPVRGLICFFNERVDLEVGGNAQERPVTQWSPRESR